MLYSPFIPQFAPSEWEYLTLPTALDAWLCQFMGLVYADDPVHGSYVWDQLGLDKVYEYRKLAHEVANGRLLGHSLCTPVLPKVKSTATKRLYRFFYEEMRTEYRLQRADHTFEQTMFIMDKYAAWFKDQNASMRSAAWKSLRASLGVWSK